MITIEIIVFIASILFGIVWYVRESKTNKVYRFFNKLMHSKELQMKEDNTKGFVHEQAFLMRLVWITVLLLLVAIIVGFIIPFNMFYIQYFVSAIVGMLIGTYIASMFFVASEELTKENIAKKAEEAYHRGKEFVEDLKGEDVEEKEVPTEETPKDKTEETPKKSARDRLKDKGMI
ncbi:MAG: hypothetical protein K0U54_12195, partial [Bacteroidetes bacterium]|nr:hypothetical protein [Bacteroidota bacterium]